jgi:hypothetical protein
MSPEYLREPRAIRLPALLDLKSIDARHLNMPETKRMPSTNGHLAHCEGPYTANLCFKSHADPGAKTH